LIIRGKVLGNFISGRNNHKDFSNYQLEFFFMLRPSAVPQMGGLDPDKRGTTLTMLRQTAPSIYRKT